MTVTVKVPKADALKDKCDYLAAELPCAWGSVLSGAGSMGAVTLTGVDSAGKALTLNGVTVDKSAVSGRTVVVKLTGTTDAKTKKVTPVYLV